MKVPVVLKAGFGFCAGWAGQHSNCIYHTMMGIPGLKVVVPSTPADAKGLMTAAIRDDNPVVYLHHYMLTLDKGEVPEGEFVVPLGRRRHQARRDRRHDRRRRLDGEEGHGCSRAIGQGGHQRGSRGSAHAGAAGREDHPRTR